MSSYPTLKRAARILGLPLGEVSWRTPRGSAIGINKDAVAMADKELRKLKGKELEHYVICIAAVAGLDYEAFQHPLLHRQCKELRKKIYEHDVVETVVECIARSRK